MLQQAGYHTAMTGKLGWSGDCGTFDWYPESDKPLGPPKGDAKRDGWTCRREFKHASVFADLEKKTAKIDWR